MKNPILASAVATVLYLSGGLLIGVGGAMFLQGFPFHIPAQTMNVLAIVIAIVSVFGGAGLWGWRMARLHNLLHTGRVIIGAVLACGVAFAAAAVLAPQLRTLFQRSFLMLAPIHVVYTFVFVPIMFLAAAIGASTLLMLSGRRIGWLGSGALAGLAAAATFLIVDLLLDALGMRVGGPGAEQRVTMLSVTFLSSAAGAFAAGAVLGRVLAQAGVNAANSSPSNPR